MFSGTCDVLSVKNTDWRHLHCRSIVNYVGVHGFYTAFCKPTCEQEPWWQIRCFQSRVFSQPPACSQQTATRQPTGTLSSSGVSHLILGQGTEMGARIASGSETRVALGIRVGLNNSALGSQNIFIFIISSAHLSVRSSLSLPERILFLRPHKYLNQLMTPLEELKGIISQHLKVGSGAHWGLCRCWFGKQSPGLRGITANPHVMKKS